MSPAGQYMHWVLQLLVMHAETEPMNAWAAATLFAMQFWIDIAHALAHS